MSRYNNIYQDDQLSFSIIIEMTEYCFSFRPLTPVLEPRLSTKRLHHNVRYLGVTSIVGSTQRILFKSLTFSLKDVGLSGMSGNSQ